MKHETIKWRSVDDLEIFGQFWKTGQTEKGVIALVHGFGEHSSRYEHVAQAFGEKGYSMFAFDHRGHGLSEGQRGHTPSYDHLMGDVDIFLEKVRDIFPDVPVLLYGHSMGGNIVANHLIRRKPEIKGAIITGPFFRTTNPPPAFQIALGKMMNKIWGAFPDKVKLDPNDLSRDKQVVEKYINDPMVHNKISARMGLTLIANGEYAIEHASEIQLPLIILHGADDNVTACSGSKEFVSRAGDNVSLVLLPDLYHEIHNEPEKADVLKRIIDWCDDLLDE
jgi:alpha-beta hydrolase superfamily lysophospholipase